MDVASSVETVFGLNMPPPGQAALLYATGEHSFNALRLLGPPSALPH